MTSAEYGDFLQSRLIKFSLLWSRVRHRRNVALIMYGLLRDTSTSYWWITYEGQKQCNKGRGCSFYLTLKSVNFLKQTPGFWGGKPRSPSLHPSCNVFVGDSVDVPVFFRGGRVSLHLRKQVRLQHAPFLSHDVQVYVQQCCFCCGNSQPSVLANSQLLL